MSPKKESVDPNLKKIYMNEVWIKEQVSWLYKYWKDDDKYRQLNSTEVFKNIIDALGE